MIEPDTSVALSTLTAHGPDGVVVVRAVLLADEDADAAGAAALFVVPILLLLVAEPPHDVSPAMVTAQQRPIRIVLMRVPLPQRATPA